MFKHNLEFIARHSKRAYSYARSLNFKDVPFIIIESISKNSFHSNQYASRLLYKNVPFIIVKSICKNKYYFYDYICLISEDKQLFTFLMKFDKRINI